MKRNCGFTLIELLVVIAIIGMLAAILFPVFAQARRAALRATCLSNVREIAFATLMYQHDNDDMLFGFGYQEGPRFETWWGDLQTGDPQYAFIYPYTKSGHIRGCPDAVNLPNVAPHTYLMGYGMNFRLFYRYPPELGDIGLRNASASLVERPAETLLCGDAAYWERASDAIVTSPWLFSDSYNNHLHARHGGDRSNVSWLDGHASCGNLDYPNGKLGVGDDVVQGSHLRELRLGDLLKYPREFPNSNLYSERDQFYSLLQKPKGL